MLDPTDRSPAPSRVAPEDPGRTGPLWLRALGAGDERGARRAHAELVGDDFAFLLDERPGESWPAYVRRLEDMRHGRGLAGGRVAATFLVAEVEGQIVGRVSVRHQLNAWLAEAGGHIGFGVRPAARSGGYATEMLRQALGVARAAGVEEALVTCDEGNVASAAVIERCGGRFERLARGDGHELPTRRYWIWTAHDPGGPDATASLLEPTGDRARATTPQGPHQDATRPR